MGRHPGPSTYEDLERHMRVVCEYPLRAEFSPVKAGTWGFWQTQGPAAKRRRVLAHRSIRLMSSAEIPRRTPCFLWSFGSCTSKAPDLYNSWFTHLTDRERYPYYRALAENSVHLELSAMGGHDARNDW